MLLVGESVRVSQVFVLAGANPKHQHLCWCYRCMWSLVGVKGAARSSGATRSSRQNTLPEGGVSEYTSATVLSFPHSLTEHPNKHNFKTPHPKRCRK